jgi:ABC-type Fe3+/spermidine/putrescine transport system ATPase subunit
MTAAAPAPALECRELAVGRGAAPVVGGIELAVAPGESLALLGASGSGKTTLLDTVAGFIPPLRGRILLGGRPTSDPRHCEPPERRSVGVVFQHYALWPHMSVLDIVAYPARRAGSGRADARTAAAALLEKLGISALAQRRPAELSGGEQQRVALARALARRPALFLFDEPTAHLDAHLRALVLDEVARHRAESGAAALLATHDAAEALAVADTVAVLDSGRLIQTGPPREVYERPADLAVARLTGPACVVTARARPLDAATAEITIGAVTAAVACAAPPGGTSLLVRPDWAELGGPFEATAARVRFRGPHTDYTLDTAAGRVDLRAAGPPRHAAGARLTWSLTRVWPLPGAADPGADPAGGRSPGAAVFSAQAAADIVH